MNILKSRHIGILIVLLAVLFDGGYAKGTPFSSTGYDFTFYYYNKDHLGNNREVLNYSGNVQQLTNYYPFGAPYTDPNAVMGSNVQPYKYNGKELVRRSGDGSVIIFEYIVLKFKKMLLYLHCQTRKHPHMPRQERTKSGTGIYHVMLRGINRQDIFEDDEDYLQMTVCLQGLTERYDENGVAAEPLCTIYSYCLMSNHIHLLVREQKEDISSVMKRLGVAYAYYFNKKYQRNGHLFQDRFRSEPVNTMEYFVTLLRYIHQNPLKAGLVSSPGDYSWSSWHEYAGTSASQPCICKTSAVISRIDTADLVALIDEPLNDCMNILDIESTEAVYHTDSELKDFLSNTHGVSNPLMVQSLEKSRRNYILKSMKDYGAGIRQLSRLTGVSYGVIQKL